MHGISHCIHLAETICKLNIAKRCSHSEISGSVTEQRESYSEEISCDALKRGSECDCESEFEDGLGYRCSGIKVLLDEVYSDFVQIYWRVVFLMGKPRCSRICEV